MGAVIIQWVRGPYRANIRIADNMRNFIAQHLAHKKVSAVLLFIQAEKPSWTPQSVTLVPVQAPLLA